MRLAIDAPRPAPSLFMWPEREGEINAICLQHVTVALWRCDTDDDGEVDEDLPRILQVYTTDCGASEEDWVALRQKDAIAFLQALALFHETVVSR